MNDEPNQSISHLERSYSNVQDFMRFMDTKAGVVFTLAGVIVGALAVKPGELESWSLFFAVIGSILAIAAMLYALRVVWPSHGPLDPKNLTLLFPALDPKAVNEDGSEPDIKRLLAAKANLPLNEKCIIGEYAAQLSHLHNPIVRKTCSLRRSILCMSSALICVGVSQFGRMVNGGHVMNEAVRPAEQEGRQSKILKSDAKTGFGVSAAEKSKDGAHSAPTSQSQ